MGFFAPAGRQKVGVRPTLTPGSGVTLCQGQKRASSLPVENPRSNPKRFGHSVGFLANHIHITNARRSSSKHHLHVISVNATAQIFGGMAA